MTVKKPYLWNNKTIIWIIIIKQVLHEQKQLWLLILQVCTEKKHRALNYYNQNNIPDESFSADISVFLDKT